MQEGGYGSVNERIPIPPISSEIWKLLLDRSQVPEVMVHTLKGEVWVTETVKGSDGRDTIVGHWEQRGEQLMNDDGVRYFSSFFYAAMSPDKLATFLTEEEVYDRAREMTKTIILIILEKGDQFGIKASNRKYVVRLLDDFYFMNLTASRRGTILNAIRQVYERHETYAPEKPKTNYSTDSMVR
jgi:hypothetical protein